jgi:hypothetical protein
MEVDIVGHSCKIKIEDLNSPIEVTIYHYGDKQPLTLNLTPSRLSPSRLITYSKI